MSTVRTAAVCGAVILSAACHRSAMVEDHSAHMAAASVSPTVAMQSSTALPASNNAAAARLAASPRHGEWIKVPFEAGSKDTIMAWIVYPATARKAPVVVVVHDINGLSAWSRGVADQAAAEGFIAVSPDFTSRVRGGP